jgi:hypothetical protein
VATLIWVNLPGALPRALPRALRRALPGIHVGDRFGAAQQ